MEYVNINPTIVIPEYNEETHETCVRETPTLEIIEDDPNKSFKILNLLSELKTDYLRLIARENLGIGDSYTLKWGNITGTITNQEDLIKFLEELITSTLNYLEKHIDSEIANIDFTLVDNATVYYGNSSTNLTLSTKKTFTTGDWEYIYVAIPNKGYPLKVNGINGGFSYLGLMTIDDGVFYLYRSDNTNLGITTITYGY